MEIVVQAANIIKSVSY